MNWHIGTSLNGPGLSILVRKIPLAYLLLEDQVQPDFHFVVAIMTVVPSHLLLSFLDRDSVESRSLNAPRELGVLEVQL